MQKKIYKSDYSFNSQYFANSIECAHHIHAAYQPFLRIRQKAE